MAAFIHLTNLQRMQTMRTPNIHVLRNKSQYLGVYQQKHNFLLGFYFESHAEQIRRISGNDPKVLVKHEPKINISREVKLTLLELSLPIYNVKDDIFLDNDGQIAFKKQRDPRDDEEVATTMSTIPFERFMALPYINNFGLILPYEYLSEDDNYILYKANVIERFYAKEGDVTAYNLTNGS
jgi:hypothetical protein